jgi:hypothetical protein
MITLFVIAGAILVVAGAVMAFCVITAPEGHEDADGFHADAPNASLWEHAKLGDAPRESHGLNR